MESRSRSPSSPSPPPGWVFSTQSGGQVPVVRAPTRKRGRSPSPPLPRGWEKGTCLGGQLHYGEKRHKRDLEPDHDLFVVVPDHPDATLEKLQKVAATDACRRARQKGTSAIGVPIAPCPITEPSQGQLDLVATECRKATDAAMIGRLAALPCFSQGKKR